MRGEFRYTDIQEKGKRRGGGGNLLSVEEEEKAERCAWMQVCLRFGTQMGRERERGREIDGEKEKGVGGGSELKRLVLPNEVNTPSGRMRLPCRAETLVTSVILYKAVVGRGEGQL